MCPKFFDAWVRLGTEIQHTVRTNNQSTTSWQGPSDEKPRQRSFPSCGAGQKRNGNWQQPQTKPQHAPCKKHVSPLAIQPWSYRCGWALYVHSGQHVLRGIRVVSSRKRVWSSLLHGLYSCQHQKNMLLLSNKPDWAKFGVMNFWGCGQKFSAKCIFLVLAQKFPEK